MNALLWKNKKKIFETKTYSKNHEVELLLGGEKFFEELIKLINSAREIIHLQTYIFLNDNVGRTVRDHLIEALKRGVRIYVMIDAFGSLNLSHEFWRTFQKKGGHFQFFNPFFSSKKFYFGRRLHHKVIVVDQRMALVGGVNIGEPFNSSQKEKSWLDFTIKLKGNEAIKINKVCHCLYNHAYHGKKRSAYHSEDISHLVDTSGTHGNCLIRIRENDWMASKNEIYLSYKQAIAYAEKNITFFASYFFPGIGLLRQLYKAVRNGVQINLVLGGKSDIKIILYAQKFLYPLLLKQGIQIYEWNDSILHAKIALVDNKWMTVGSYNLNYIGRFNDIEMNVEVLNKDYILKISECLDDLIKSGCQKIQLDEWMNGQNYWSRFRNMTSYFLMKFAKSLAIYFLPLKKYHL